VEAIDAFALEAVRYCTLMEGDSADDAALDTVELSRTICRLCAGALQLPRDWSFLDEPSIVRPTTLKGLDSLRPVDHYWMLLDPYEPDVPVSGSLQDDLTDIYMDLQSGLTLYNMSDPEAYRKGGASWRFNFEIHWGSHAWAALAVLHAVNKREWESE
jgi:hypothetical protein